MKKLFIVTGEYSGDLHASRVVRELQQQNAGIEIEAIGGINLESAGVKLFGNHSKMSAGGISLKIILDHFSLGKRLMNYLKNEYKPDLVLLIDYGGFNLNIARAIKKDMPGTKIFYYIPPQIWASRKWRINTVKKYIDKVLHIFPFEAEMYAEKGIDAEYVGHPLIEEIPAPTDKEVFFAANGLDINKKLIGVFPGSRTLEINNLMPVYTKTIEILKEKFPDVQFALCQSPNIKDELLAKYKLPEFVKVLKNVNYKLLSTSDVLMLASGTVTLEAALYGTPMVVCYCGPDVLYWAYLLIRCINRVALPNIVAGKDVVEELIQYRCTPKNISDEIASLLEDKAKLQEMKNNLKELQNKLSEKNSAKEVARAIKNTL